MNIEEMKSTIRKMNEDSWHKRNLDEVYLLYTDEIVFHRPPFPPVKNKLANRESDEGVYTAFTETKSTIHELIGEGDTVIAHWT